MSSRPQPSDVRAAIDHPVIDADGHTVEYLPALQKYLEREGVDLALDAPYIQVRYPGFGHQASAASDAKTSNQGTATGSWYTLTDEERARYHAVRSSWRGAPTRSTDDFAAGMIPALMYRRMQDIGIDFAIIYPTVGLVFLELADESTRRGACRALNKYYLDVFGDVRDRLEPVAAVPMQTPAEGIEELERAVDMGFKAVLIPSWIKRPTPIVAETAPQLAPYSLELDTYGIDSPYDYDPFWKRCIELGVSLATHSASIGVGTRRSTSSFMYNHIGHFATSGEACAKSLFFGGVTRRFPRLRIAFLEGGVHWAAALLFDLVARWEKRNRKMIDVNYAPSNLDPERFTTLFEQYAAPVMKSAAPKSGVVIQPREVHPREVLDEFAACGIVSEEDIPALFAPNFFFGCEAEDPMVATAFGRPRPLPFGVHLNAMFSSDVGHWDVPDMSMVLGEAWEQVEDGVLSREEFRAFSYENVARFYLESNPDFFADTAVAREVASLVETSQSQ